MFKALKRMFVYASLAIMTFTGFTQSVQAAMVGTDQAQAAAATEQNRARILSALDRPDVISQLEKMGVAPDDARERVAALTDSEAAMLADRIDSMPAGGDSFLGVLLFVFLLLLVTDILGLTKVFPFTRSQR